ncbi:uncharacterized protein LOC134705715 [Mytilus trossulus]|uniref:uncharacterized protein LOC134705715 n=1 Tax=Mytilus trossulus TaxID=6551 RepID=UPI0030054E24
MDEFTFTSFDHLESKLEKCDDCCNGDYMSFHCPLCPVSKYKPRKKAKLQQHLAVHWNTRIQGNNDSYSVVCHLQHGDISTRHFHCTCCGKIIKKKENMVTHLRKCQINNKEHTEDNSAKGTTNLVTDNSIPHLDKSFNDEHDYSYKSRVSKSVPMSPKKSKSKKACQICGKLVSKRWMRSHMKIHKKENDGQNEINQHRHHYTALVDSNSGIYCSATNLSGPLYPVHAIKMTSGANQDSFCENQQCIDSKDTAKRGGNIAYECAHIRSVPYAVRGKDIILQDTTLMSLKSQNFITEARSAELLQLKETLARSGSPLAVEIPPMENASSRYRYFSVSTGSPKYWSRTYRTIVSYDSTLNKYTCKCSNAARYCMHKAIVKCCIYQETPNFFTNEEGVNLEDNNVTSFDYENDTESQGVLKKDKIKFDLMLNYIASMKKIPANPEVENALYERTSFLQENKITARETSCHKCDGDLALEKISSRSKIVTMRKIFKDVEVYVKVCPRCRTVYRFQEWIEGIHNYNNSTYGMVMDVDYRLVLVFICHGYDGGCRL